MDQPSSIDTILDALVCDRLDGFCDLTVQQIMERTSLTEHEIRNAVAKLLAWRQVEIYKGDNDALWVRISDQGRSLDGHEGHGQEADQS
jgi:hypothetical protein